jgi:hypothetical protein
MTADETWLHHFETEKKAGQGMVQTGTHALDSH